MPSAGRRPLVGGYYWFPAPEADGLTWSVLNCHDLGFGPDVGHVELWPALLDRLGAAWARQAGPLRSRLGDRYTGLPRGRVTRPRSQYMILHGDDAPIADWTCRVLESFGLTGRPHRFLFDEHERMLPGDPQRLEVALGRPLGLVR